MFGDSVCIFMYDFRAFRVVKILMTSPVGWYKSKVLSRKYRKFAVQSLYFIFLLLGKLYKADAVVVNTWRGTDLKTPGGTRENNIVLHNDLCTS